MYSICLSNVADVRIDRLARMVQTKGDLCVFYVVRVGDARTAACEEEAELFF